MAAAAAALVPSAGWMEFLHTEKKVTEVTSALSYEDPRYQQACCSPHRSPVNDRGSSHKELYFEGSGTTLMREAREKLGEILIWDSFICMTTW